MEGDQFNEDLFSDQSKSKVTRRNPMLSPLATLEEYKRLRDSRVEILRKKDRNNIFKRKRLIEDIKEDEPEIGPPIPSNIEAQEEVKPISIANLPEVVKEFNSADSNICFTGLNKLRRLLASTGTIPIQQILDTGVLQRMIELLKEHDKPLIQLEAAWCITNIATGDKTHIMAILNKGGLMPILELLKSSNMKIQEQAVWTLGNIAGEDEELRDVVLETEALESVVEILNRTKIYLTMKTCLWCLLNLCRGKPLPSFNKVEPVDF